MWLSAHNPPPLFVASMTKLESRLQVRPPDSPSSNSGCRPSRITPSPSSSSPLKIHDNRPPRLPYPLEHLPPHLTYLSIRLFTTHVARLVSGFEVEELKASNSPNCLLTSGLESNIGVPTVENESGLVLFLDIWIKKPTICLAVRSPAGWLNTVLRSRGGVGWLSLSSTEPPVKDSRDIS